jgi:endonuclease/exonuclease/phosphatase family metal-dependent hydrolase
VTQNGLRVLTYNLWCHLFVGGRDMRGRLEAFVAAAACYDVVAVQEVFRFFVFGRQAWSREAVFLEEAMRANGFKFSESLNGPSFGQDAGLMIFSRHAITRCSFHAFCVSDEQPFTNKGYLYAETGGMHVINTHFDSRSEASKRGQIAELVRFLSELPGGPVVLVGDFNICQQHIWDQGDLYQHLAESLRGSDLKDQASGQELVTFPDDGACYDHFFVRGTNCTDFGVQDFNVSDHVGLAAVLNLAPLR